MLVMVLDTWQVGNELIMGSSSKNLGSTRTTQTPMHL